MLLPLKSSSHPPISQGSTEALPREDFVRVVLASAARTSSIACKRVDNDGLKSLFYSIRPERSKPRVRGKGATKKHA